MSEYEIEATVRELADRDAIRDLANRYAHYVWTKDVAAIVELFADDGVMDTGDGRPIRGGKAIRQVYGKVFAGSDFQPFVHNHVIVIDGDSASGACYLDLRATQNGKSMIGSGYYEDRYTRVKGKWKFSSRRLTMRFFVPLEEGWSGRAADPPSAG